MKDSWNRKVFSWRQNASSDDAEKRLCIPNIYYNFSAREHKAVDTKHWSNERVIRTAAESRWTPALVEGTATRTTNERALTADETGTPSTAAYEAFTASSQPTTQATLSDQPVTSATEVIADAVVSAAAGATTASAPLMTRIGANTTSAQRTTTAAAEAGSAIPALTIDTAKSTTQPTGHTTNEAVTTTQTTIVWASTA